MQRRTGLLGVSLQGAAHLAGDLGFADDHRVQPAGDLEEMLHGIAQTVDIHHADQITRTGFGEQITGETNGLMEVLGVDIQFAPVAGRQHDQPADTVGCAQAGARLLGAGGELRQIVAGHLVVAQPHCEYRHGP
ncbi:hypothetical protein SDC9_187538 [bioreactor metagenome]|uniref:Uncharacterized protein n=1 Tax=bioreactor metagenome TaxID=1076179 RepID=A0A645HXF3_9ZZZZ